MIIERLRINEEETIDTKDGPVSFGPSYFMDVAINEEEVYSVPVEENTYRSLHSLMTLHDQPEQTNKHIA